MKLILYIGNDLEDKIQEIRSSLSTEDSSSRPHLTIALFSADARQMLTQLMKELNEIYAKYSENQIKDFELVNESRDNANWISIKIFDRWLKDFNQDTELLLDRYGINETLAYKSEIREIRRQYSPKDVQLSDCIADHIDLVDKCKPDFAEKAFSKFQFINDIDSILPGDIAIKKD